METYDYYALVPDRNSLESIINSLFVFKNVNYNDLECDIDIHSFSELLEVVSHRLNNGSGLHFNQTHIKHTSGGWLYKLDDGVLVVGLSGSVVIDASFFFNTLKAIVPNSHYCLAGDCPPPADKATFIKLSNVHS